MPLLTIVEHYVMAALERAVPECFENGTYGAYVPECPGVLGFGSDVHECARDLSERLEEWVKVSLAAGNPLPVIDGIDLNSEASQILASYHTSDDPPPTGEFYADEHELEAAFARRSKRSPTGNGTAYGSS